jgi:putative transposase
MARLKRNTPVEIHCENGPEFIGSEFVSGAKTKNIRINYIQAGNPLQNAYIELHNRTIKFSLAKQALVRFTGTSAGLCNKVALVLQ